MLIRKVLLSALSMVAFPADSSARHHWRHHARPAHHARHVQEKVEPVKVKAPDCPAVPTLKPWSVWMNARRFYQDYDSHVYAVVKAKPVKLETIKAGFVLDHTRPSWAGALERVSFATNQNPQLEQDLRKWFERQNGRR